MAATPKITRRKITDYRPALVNPNAGSERGVAVIEDSLASNGAGRSLLADKDGEMIAGSHTLEAMVSAGFTEVIEIETDGRIPVVVRRTDLSIDDPRGRALQIVDNRANEVGYRADDAVISAILADIKEQDATALRGTGYNTKEINALLEDVEESTAALMDGLLDDELPPDGAPDAIWPSDNDWGVPTLLLEHQATALDMPYTRWGKSTRKGKMRGTYHFYTDNYKFEALWSDPTPIIASECINAVEPNVSTNNNMPRAAVLWGIYKKRWIARFWQQYGVKVFVDLNVEIEFADIALLGVPHGWKAYSNRGYGGQADHLETAFKWACERSGSDNPLYVVYGGGKAIKEHCKTRGWLYVMEDAHATEGREY